MQGNLSRFLLCTHPPWLGLNKKKRRRSVGFHVLIVKYHSGDKRLRYGFIFQHNIYTNKEPHQLLHWRGRPGLQTKENSVWFTLQILYNWVASAANYFISRVWSSTSFTLCLRLVLRAAPCYSCTVCSAVFSANVALTRSGIKVGSCLPMHCPRGPVSFSSGQSCSRSFSAFPHSLDTVQSPGSLSILRLICPPESWAHGFLRDHRCDSFPLSPSSCGLDYPHVCPPVPEGNQ